MPGIAFSPVWTERRERILFRQRKRLKNTFKTVKPRAKTTDGNMTLEGNSIILEMSFTPTHTWVTQCQQLKRLSFTLVFITRLVFWISLQHKWGSIFPDSQCRTCFYDLFTHWDLRNPLLLRQSWSSLRFLADLPQRGSQRVQSLLGFRSPSLKYATLQRGTINSQ